MLDTYFIHYSLVTPYDAIYLGHHWLIGSGDGL